MMQDLLYEQKSLFAPGVHTELRGQKNRNRRVVLLSGDVLANVRSDVSGVSARVYRNGVWGFSSMAEYSQEAAATVLKAASENAAFMDRHAGNGRPAPAPLAGGEPLVMDDFHDPAQKVYVDFAREVDAYIAAHCPGLTSRKVIATEDSMEKILKVSDGRDAHILSPRSYVYVFLSAETPAGAPVELFRAFGGSGTFDVNFSDPSALHEGIDELYGRLMQKREGVYADAGEKTVILGGMMTGMLSHEAVGLYSPKAPHQ